MKPPTPPKRTTIIPDTVFEDVDEHGVEYTIYDLHKQIPSLQVFYGDGVLVVRQENTKSVDVLGITLGQAYDLMAVLARALDIPVRVY